MASTIGLNKVYLYKTPFNNSYENVMDAETSLQYADYIDKMFAKYTVQTGLSNDRYFKFTNGKTQLVLPIPYNELQKGQYNYMKIESYSDLTPNTKFEFYFITAFSSYNSGNAVATLINIEYDIWANSIYSLSNYAVPYQARRATINAYTVKDNISYASNIIGAKQLPTLYTINRSSRIATPSAPLPLFTDPRVIWAKLTLDSNELYGKIGGESTYTKLTNVGVFASASQLPVIYAPVGFMTPNGLELENISPGNYLYAFKGYKSQQVSETWSVRNLDFKINGLHVVEASLTFYPPFRVEFDYDSSTFTIDKHFEVAEVAFKDGDEYTAPIKIGSGLSDYDYYTTICVYAKEKDYIINWTQRLTYADIYTPQLSLFSGTDMTESNIWNNSVTARVPYNDYIKILVSGTSIDVIPPAKCLRYRIVLSHIEDSVFIYINFYDADDNIIYRTNNIKVDDIGLLPIVADSESVYMRNNGNSISAKTFAVSTQGVMKSIDSLFSIGTGALTGNYNKALGGALSLVNAQVNTDLALQSIDAQIKDVANQRDVITTIDTSAVANIFRNQIMIMEIYADYTDPNVICECYNEHYFGLPCNKYIPFNSKYKKYFDYKQFANISLPIIGNTSNRKELENAFLRGVTVWHSSDIISNNKQTYLQNLNKNIGNEVV